MSPTRRFEQLLQAGIEIAHEHELDAVLRKIVESAQVVVGAKYVALGVIGPDGTTLSRFETIGINEEQMRAIGPFPVGHGILGVIIKEGRPLRIPRISQHPGSVGFPAHHPPMETLLGVPIKGREHIYGDLYMSEKVDGGDFTEDDERIAVLLAAQAAAAIESAQLLESLQTLHRQRDQFFAMINHELRNALTGVYGWAEQLLRAKSPASAERAGREVYESAERTIALLNNLLDLSRLDAGKVQTVYRRARLADIIERAIGQVRTRADAKQIAIRTELADVPETLETDALRLEQIVGNLLSNAVRHGPDGEDIVVRAERLGPELLIHVIDRGKGIAQEDQPLIFEPYIRVDPESGIGSGLGLPVSRRMAELLGGRLSVSSDPGKGATFTLKISSQFP